MLPNRMAEVAVLFLRLGFTAFGGPVAHIAMMRQEIVLRRKWISDERFVDLMSVVNLIPGPNSTELAIYLGYARAGWPGLLVGGVCFIGPAMLIVLAFAWLYVHYGSLPQAVWLFYGIKPVVIAIIVQALWGLCRTVLRRVIPIVLALFVLVLYLLGVNELVLLLSGGIIFSIVRWIERCRKAEVVSVVLPFSFGNIFGNVTNNVTNNIRKIWPLATSGAGLAVVTIPISLLTLFLTFLKIGATLYGSGYVLLAFLRNDFVQNLGWLTDRQLLDAVSIGQFTPGPVFTTATFIGYLVAGWQGALLATLGIFLPSFVFVAIIHPLAATLRSSPWTSSILDGVNIAAVALMAGVLLQLGRSAFIDILTWAIALVALVILLRFKINSFWLILAGGIIGMLRFWLL